MKVCDIKDMPGFNSVVPNGIASVSQGKAFWDDTPNRWGVPNKATCIVHGAMLCVSPDRRLWRCPTCNEGLYVL